MQKKHEEEIYMREITPFINTSESIKFIKYKYIKIK